jgi:hypothetical protein
MDVHPGTAHRHPSRAKTLYRLAIFSSRAPQASKQCSSMAPSASPSVGRRPESRSRRRLTVARTARKSRTDFPVATLVLVP